jgi:hypothetical protein
MLSVEHCRIPALILTRTGTPGAPEGRVAVRARENRVDHPGRDNGQVEGQSLEEAGAADPDKQHLEQHQGSRRDGARQSHDEGGPGRGDVRAASGISVRDALVRPYRPLLEHPDRTRLYRAVATVHNAKIRSFLVGDEVALEPRQHLERDLHDADRAGRLGF